MLKKCGLLDVIAVGTPNWMGYTTDRAADVGGGSVRNGTRNSLARIPLRWMIRECFKLNVGILFHRDMFKQIGMDPASLYPHVQARPPPMYQAPKVPGSPDSTMKALTASRPKVVNGDPTVVAYCDNGDFVSEEVEDMLDAVSPMYDQLRIGPVWWLLEVIPQPLRYQDDDDDAWVQKYTCVPRCLACYIADIAGRVNMGAGRHLPRQRKVGVKIHRSVKIRMEADLEGGKYWPKAKLAVEPEWVD